MTSTEIIDACLLEVAEIVGAETVDQRVDIAGRLAGYLAALKERQPAVVLACVHGRPAGQLCPHCPGAPTTL